MGNRPLRIALWVAFGVALWFGYQKLTDKTGEVAPPLTGGVWVAQDAATVPSIVNGRAPGRTLYAFFSPT